MRRLLVLAAVTAVAVARPETYREKEDFQYSRSSSDDGSKSGYYGAQRGNMGGNYERAHNMDALAQHQMSGLVRQTQGELGDGATERSGSVFTAANSRGMYGSGHYDLSNLEGRNFQEGVTQADSQSHSSMSSQSAGYKGHSHSTYSHGGYGDSNAYNSRYRGYNTGGNSDQMLYANVQQHDADELQVANQESRHESRNSGYNSRSGYNSQSGYSQANLNSADRFGSNAQHSHRLVGVSAIPVRVVLRPGTRIAVPVAAETYDASHGSSTFDHNAINTEAESGNNQHVAYQPTSNGKHYESSYSYRKEWEKHNRQPGSVPVVIPTINPYPQNSELYEDAQAHNTEQQEAHNSHSSHRSYVKSAASQHQADYNSQHHSSASNADSSAYTLQHSNGAALSQVLNNQVEDLSSKPKSYQSSYSYHKSWEHQGDPYVIKPLSTSSDASQKLTAASSNHGAYSESHQYGSHNHYGSQKKTYLNNVDEDCDCDENGHVRVARSYNSIPGNQQQEDLTQQTQHQSDRLEDLGQQTQNKWDKYEDLGQHTQNLDLTQQSQNRWEKLEDLGQQTQNQWGNQQATVSHSNWNTLELEPQTQTDTEQQTQNKWSTFETMKNEHNKHDDQKSTGYENTNPSNTFNVGFNPGTENINSYNNFELQKENNDASILGHHFQTVWNESQKPDKNTQDLGQQTQDQSHVFHSAFNNNDDEFKPTWHHSINSDQTSYSYNKPYFNYGQSNNAWMNNQEQFINNEQNGYHSHWQTQSVSNPEQSWTEHTNLDTNDKIHSSDTSLSSLWDKLDNIEKQSVASQGTDVFNDHSTNQHTGQTHTDSDFEHTYQHHNYHNTYDKEEKHKVNKSLDDKEVPTVVTSTTTDKVKVFDILNNHEILRPQDIGRGDIGPEESITTTEETFYVKPLQSFTKPHKTPEEIKVLSLSKDSDKTTTSTQKTTTSTQTNQYRRHHQNDYEELGVLNLDKNKQTETHNFEHNEDKLFKPTTTPKNLFEQNTREQNTEQQVADLEQHHENVESLGQEFVDIGQQNENVDFGQHENGGVNFEQQSQNADAQYEQQSSYFDQHNNGFHQESLNHNKPEAFNNQQNEQFEQELVPLQVEDLSQHNKREQDQKHWEQKYEKEDHNNNFEQENLEQQPQNFEQQTGNFEPENLEQHAQNFEQQTGNFEHENLEQHAQNFEQQTGNFEHENLEQHAQNFEQQTGNFEHENLEQHTQNVDKQTGKFEHENLEQQPQNFRQQIGNFEQENLEQHTQNVEQQTGKFVHENLEQHAQNFEQQTGNFEQENLEQHTQNVEQQTRKFVHENLEQQPQNFEQQTGNFEHTNLEQQQTGNFEHENWKQEWKQQSEWKSNEDLQKQEIDKFHHHAIPERIEQSNIDVEPPMVSKKVADEETPPEQVTEKVGFWKSVGNKLGNAKDKVASWFKST